MRTMEEKALCLLADRSRVAAAYGNPRETTFYPLAFHPRYGNFSSKRPPEFLSDLLTVLRDNMSLPKRRPRRCLRSEAPRVTRAA